MLLGEWPQECCRHCSASLVSDVNIQHFMGSIRFKFPILPLLRLSISSSSIYSTILWSSGREGYHVTNTSIASRRLLL